MAFPGCEWGLTLGEINPYRHQDDPLPPPVISNPLRKSNPQ